ncbi:MAG: endonuclease III [Polyangiaceae bacterium]|nr:endonuclease III [Polyangiaceae bacterium]
MASRASRSSSTSKTRRSAPSSTDPRARTGARGTASTEGGPQKAGSQRAPAKKATTKRAPATKKAATTSASSKGPPRRPPSAKVEALRARAADLFARLQQIHPDAHCELDHQGAFQLLVATVLSAQTTDKAVNKVTPALFSRYPSPDALAKADVAEVAELLRVGGLGMFNQKGKNIVGLSRALVEVHRGEVPRSLDALIELPGVGRKTANVVLGVMWNIPEGVVVDTHVQRLSQRLGLTKEQTPEKIELALCALYPRDRWDALSHLLIFHGRRVCFAIKPACSACKASDLCPNAFRADDVGRKKR